MEEDKKREIEIKTINVPGGVYVGGGPTFASSSYIRHTKEGGEQFGWIKGVPREGVLWLGGGGDGWVPTGLGKKEGEPRIFYSAPDSPVQVKDRDEELKWQQARIREARKGGPAGEAAERLLDFHEKAKKGE